MYYVYLIKLNNNKIYTGFTDNIDERLKDHNNGKCNSTKNYRPVKLEWFCSFSDELKARRFEIYLKTGSGQAFRNKRLI